jgi:signal recognition particle subunit SEC65
MGTKFTKEEIGEIEDALENSFKYYTDLLEENTSHPLANNNPTIIYNVQYARTKIKIIESIKKKLNGRN